MTGAPYPKSKQLGPAKRPRRAFRKRASKTEWQAIAAAKLGPCRVCCDPGHNGSQFGRIQLHHLVSRARGGGDCAENIVPLCLRCHLFVTDNCGPYLDVLRRSLTDAEYAYVIGKLGEGGVERL